MKLPITRLCNVLSIILATAVASAGAESFCDLCGCSEDLVASKLVIECNGARRDSNFSSTAHEMQYLEWPETDVDTIVGYFNHLNLTVLPRLQGNPKVAILNFDNNLIRTLGPKSFQYFEQLDEISMRNNFISDVPRDFLFGLSSLGRLVLANNSIASINVAFVSDLQGLRLLDLSHNQLTTVAPELAAALGRAETVDLSFNQIASLDSGDSEPQWQHLNVSYNHLHYLLPTSFKTGSRLRSLSVAENFLTTLEDKTFELLPSLASLDLSSNQLHGLNLLLPDSLECVRLGNNSLRLWPLQNVPANLTHLDVHGNELSEIFPGHDAVQNLQFFNASRNLIDSFPEIQFTHLRVLDLSYNSFISIPPQLARYTLQLEELVMDNNPIAIISFGEKLRLNKLSLRNMPLVTAIPAFSFSNIEGTKVRKDQSSTCLDIIVSHCDNLEHVSEDAFLGVRLCYLDLSYNRITKLPSNLTDWQLLEDGVNLQGNPLHCDCDSQWMLDHILITLYQDSQHQHLLADLRCGGGTEPVFKNQRFVRFYKRENVFCDPDPAFLRSIKYDTLSELDDEVPEIQLGNVRVRLTGGMPSYVIIIIVSAVVLILIVISGVYLTRVQNRKLNARNRRYQS